MTYDDWRYNDFNTKLRKEVLKILMHKYGHIVEKGLPKHPPKFIYECAHDWISQGNKTSHGVTKYFEENYS